MVTTINIDNCGGDVVGTPHVGTLRGYSAKSTEALVINLQKTSTN